MIRVMLVDDHALVRMGFRMLLANAGIEVVAEALDDLADRTRRSQPGVQIDVRIALGAARLPAEIALAVYRAAQEGITNALRHGHAQRLQLAVDGSDTGLTLTLTDDGDGLPADWSERAGHYGLRWLGERAQALRGRLELAAGTPHGAVLRLALPLPAGAA